jgi:hypothetical protein
MSGYRFKMPKVDKDLFIYRLQRMIDHQVRLYWQDPKKYIEHLPVKLSGHFRRSHSNVCPLPSALPSHSSLHTVFPARPTIAITFVFATWHPTSAHEGDDTDRGTRNVSTITHIHGASATSFDGWC